ncbi:copper resistance protein B [Parvularcula dongshanensis]|uniref:Copper resistance protein B n=1 Tax=Parvularcula dongshanensis TaxID=1173995 RepID=A0A840I805_9PROT|nr:copper resistance protein B [Parvularcula dongshanensis]MBB4660238.1 copper resistance protein B [Parvularcula dongshanensis]
MKRPLAFTTALISFGSAVMPAHAQEAPENPPWNAADDVYGPAVMARARDRVLEENGETPYGLLMTDRLEWQDTGEDGVGLWDVQGYYGGDINKAWVKSEGEYDFGENAFEEAEVQLLYSRAITAYFDLQAGIRQDFEPSGETYAVVGLQGLAPYWFEVDGALFLSENGDLTARFEAEYEVLLTQRLILQPRLEVEAAAQDVGYQDLGAGFTGISVGTRLRYEIRREFAPYVGVAWSSALGETSQIAQDSGGDPNDARLVLGIRSWY